MDESARLRQGFGFTEDDLSLNRRGELSPRQLKQVAARRRLQGKAGRVALVVFAMMATGFTIFAVMLDGSGSEQARPFLLGFAGFMWGVLGVVALLQHAGTKDLKAGRVSVLEGPVRLRKKTVRTPETKLGTAFMVSVARTRFQLETPEQFDALHDSAAYRFHLVRYGRVPLILSVERLS